MLRTLLRLHKDLHQPVHNQAKALLLFKQDCFSGCELPGLHSPRQLVKDRSLEIAKDFDRAQELIKVVRQATLSITRHIRVKIDGRLLSLRLRGKSCIHVQIAIPDDPAYRRDDCKGKEQTTEPISENMSTQSMVTYSVVAFMVIVRLAENNVNSHVGKEIVVKVMIEYRIPGRSGSTLRTADPKPWPLSSLAAGRLVTLAAAAVEFIACATDVMIGEGLR